MINTETNILGLIGNPVAHSKSPLMHNTMLQKIGLNYCYLAFDVHPDNLEQAISGIKALGIKGLNVTIPHKVKVMPLLDEISPEAAAIGAVNTIVNNHGKLIGYNTDGEGYIRSLIEETGINLDNKRIMILGAGGAARAIAYTISRNSSTKIILVNRSQERANQLLNNITGNHSLAAIDYQLIEDYIKDIDIIINTTSVGMAPNTNATLIKKEWLKPNQLISDIIYNPLKTQLLKDAEDQGATVHGGLGMFIYQGVIAFEKWTGYKADSQLMRQAILSSN